MVSSTTIFARIAAVAQPTSNFSATIGHVSGTASNTLSLTGTVDPAGQPPVVTSASFSGQVGVPFSNAITASGGATNFTLASGTLPGGLTFNSNNGTITGTPTNATIGTNNLTVTAANAVGSSSETTIGLAIAKGSQTITFGALSTRQVGDAPFTLSATANSGLPVSYASSSNSVATVSSNTVTIVGAGTTTITASQAGDDNWNAATSVNQNLTVVLPPLAAWEVSGLTGGNNNWGSSPFAQSFSNTNVSVVGLTRGSGIGTSGSAAGSAWGGVDFQNTNVAAAISGGDFITFTLTPKSGYKMSISGFPAFNLRRSGTGPTNAILQYQRGTGSFADIGTSSSLILTNSASSGNLQTAIDLSGVTDLQNVPAGTTITFRLVAWGGTSSSGSFYVNNISGDDLAIQGTVAEDTTVVPTFSSFSPAYGSTGSSVTISGSNLSGVTGVKFGSQTATFNYQSSNGTIVATVPAGFRSEKIVLVYGTPAAEVLSAANFDLLDGSGTASVANATGSSPYLNSAIFPRAQSGNQTVAVTISNVIAGSSLTGARITLPADFSAPNEANVTLSGTGTKSVSGNAILITGADIQGGSTLTVTISGLSTPNTATSVTQDGNYIIQVETAGAGGTLGTILASPSAYVVVPIINLRGVDTNGVAIQLGKRVAFEGVITAGILGSNSGKTRAYLQDSTAGVYLYSTAVTAAPTEGNLYTVLGMVNQFRGLTQIDPGSASNLIDRGASTAPEPTVLTLPISTTDGERYEGSLVKLVGLSRDPANTSGWTNGAAITLQNESASQKVDLYLQPGNTATTEPSTYPVNVVGILGQYVPASPFTSGYQIQPRTQGDLTAPPTITSTNAFSGTVGVLFSNNITATGDAPITFSGTGLPGGLSVASGGAISGTPTAAGTFNATLTATNEAGTNNQPATFTIAKGTPTITVAPTASSVTVGLALSNSVISGGTANPASGSWVWDTPTTTVALGTNSYAAIYVPADDLINHWNPVTNNLTVVGLAAAGGGFDTDAWLAGETLNSVTLGKLAIGGASSATANDGEKPAVSVAGGQLVLSAIVRTNGPAGLNVVGEAVSSLADYGTPASVTTVNGSTNGVSQTNVPAGCERQEFKVNQDGGRKFLRLKATLP